MYTTQLQTICCRVQYWKSNAIVTFADRRGGSAPFCGRLPALDLEHGLHTDTLVHLPAIPERSDFDHRHGKIAFSCNPLYLFA